MKGRVNKRKQLLFVWTIRCAVVVFGISLWFFFTLDEPDQAVVPGAHVEGLTAVLAEGKELAPGSAPIRFVDVTEQAGIAFHHFPWTRSSMLPEDMGSGVACADYDNDGLVDLFLVNFAGPIGSTQDSNSETNSASSNGSSPGPDGRCRLYRNLGQMRFEDVTEASGLGIELWGMGASWGDYDGDGDRDLYVTGYKDNALFQNLGDGTFVDVTEECGVQDRRFSSGASWGDFDRDGDLDLYVCNYVDFIFRDADSGVTSKQYGSEQPYTLNPSAYKPQANSLFENLGDGAEPRFRDVAKALGVSDPEGRSLSASWVDMNNDGWLDLYVANDISNNGVFLSRLGDGLGSFEDVGPSSLAADYRGAMGLAIGDFDSDLDQDILVTHWLAQENALFRNMLFDPLFDPSAEQRLWFLDAADEVGLGQVSLDSVGWATGFVDFDNDGYGDLWVVNGSTFERVENHRKLVSQPPFIFWWRDPDGFVDVTAESSAAIAHGIVGRGGAAADFDQDGLVDLVIAQNGGEARIFKNVSPGSGHWLGVSLRQSGANQFAVGARVVVTAGTSRDGGEGKRWMAAVGSSSSYLSQDDLTLHFGLGQFDSVDLLRIDWPDGTSETHRDVTADRLVTFTRKAQDDS